LLYNVFVLKCFGWGGGRIRGCRRTRCSSGCQTAMNAPCQSLRHPDKGRCSSNRSTRGRHFLFCVIRSCTSGTEGPGLFRVPVAQSAGSSQFGKNAYFPLANFPGRPRERGIQAKCSCPAPIRLNRRLPPTEKKIRVVKMIENRTPGYVGSSQGGPLWGKEPASAALAGPGDRGRAKDCPEPGL